MTELEQACHDLAAWYCPVAELLAEPDADGSVSRSKPHSQPPGNPAVLNVVTDISAGVRAVEGQLRVAVSGTVLVRGGSDGNTLKALRAIPALSEALPSCPPRVIVNGRELPCRCISCEATRTMNRLLTSVLQLPAIDLEEQPLRLAAPCPRCNRVMLRYRRITDELACLGCQRKANPRSVSGESFLRWDDGEYTIAPQIQLPEGLAS